MEGALKFRRKLALLSSCALILQSIVATLPAQAFDTQDNMAAFLYWKLPLGGSPEKDVQPTYGFSVEQTHQGWLFAPSIGANDYTNSPGSADTVAMPAFFDMHFGGGDDALPSLSLSGMDVVPVITGQLNAFGQPGTPWEWDEWLAAGLGTVAVGLGACAAAGCFSSNDHHAAAAAEDGG